MVKSVLVWNSVVSLWPLWTRLNDKLLHSVAALSGFYMTVTEGFDSDLIVYFTLLISCLDPYYCHSKHIVFVWSV
jgi:hypothetical protein